MATLAYDETILQKFAEDLYAQARSIIVSAILRYGLFTYAFVLLVTTGISYLQHSPAPGLNYPPGLFLAVIAGIVGFNVGRQKAFLLKLGAQKILCQQQIERNTRRVAKSDSTISA